MNREVAWRLFAGEYNDSNLEAGGGGDRAPTYVVTPLGARVNRLFVVGVLTDVENVGTDGQPMWRARITDPTGTFHVYAGQYQPEAAAKLAKIKPPAFAAVAGKSRWLGSRLEAAGPSPPLRSVTAPTPRRRLIQPISPAGTRRSEHGTSRATAATPSW